MFQYYWCLATSCLIRDMVARSVDSIYSITNISVNKAISMMRGKSPRSDVEMSKKLNFVASVLDFGGHFSINFDQIGYTYIKFTSE